MSIRKTLLVILTGAVLSLCLFLKAETQSADAKVRLRLIDAKSGKDVGGMIRVFQIERKEPLMLPGLFDRLRGLDRSDVVAGWSVLPAGGKETTLPRTKLRFEAVAGLETSLGRQEADLTGTIPDEIVVPLRFFFHPEEKGLVAGNTHLHLRGMTLEESNEYLRQIPAADGLKVLFISYLERRQDDQHYITNRYPIGDLEQFSPAGILVNNGEEHRHNFDAFGQGYGHVMMLAIKQLVKPVSLGPGITGEGNDDQPLQTGIDEARRQGGTVLWCHNTNGHEDVPNVLAGRIAALNVFDGSRTGNFEENYYRYLNLGLRLPLSTGTDWFLYDFARVYAELPGKPTIPRWLEAVKAGRCLATNGPLLTLTVDGKRPGDVIQFDHSRTVRIEATGIGRHDFRALQLIQNGQVVHREPAANVSGSWSARMQRDIRLDASAWFAVRIDSPAHNEFDRPLFAHSSPVYVDVAGKPVFDVEAARGLLRQLEESQADIQARGKFSNPAARVKILGLYDEAARDLRQRMDNRK